MKKPLVVTFIAASLLFNTAGFALASPITQYGDFETAIESQVMTQNAVYVNQAIAVSGPAIGTGISVAPVVAVSVLGGNATGSSTGNALGAAISEAAAANIPLDNSSQTGAQ
jgi:hypothetical protein